MLVGLLSSPSPQKNPPPVLRRGPGTALPTCRHTGPPPVSSHGLLALHLSSLLVSTQAVWDQGPPR